MGHDGQPALLVDLRDRGLEALIALQPGLQEDAQQVAAARRDLFGDDNLYPAAALTSQALALHGGFDALVIGDGDDVQVSTALGVVEDLGRRCGPVRGYRMDVHVRLAHS